MMKNKSLRKMKRDFKAISPVVATILLVLVAVAAAVAFYVFESGWQAQQSKNINNQDISTQSDLSIVGSTTVQPFMDTAAAAYMTDHPGVKVTVAGGGSGAGRTAIESSPATADIGTISEAWTATDAANYPEIKATTIGYDGIVVIIGASAATTHHLTATDLANLTRSDVQAVYSKANHDVMTWDAFHTLLNPSWTGTTDTAKIVTYERDDASGTEDGFDQMVLNDTTKTYFTSVQAADVKASGNPGMISGVSGNANAIGFTSFGMASSNANLKYFSLDGVAPSATSIKAQITSGNGYCAARPLNVLAPATATGVTADFIAYILEHDNNIAFNNANGYVPLY